MLGDGSTITARVLLPLFRIRTEDVGFVPPPPLPLASAIAGTSESTNKVTANVLMAFLKLANDELTKPPILGGPCYHRALLSGPTQPLAKLPSVNSLRSVPCAQRADDGRRRVLR
jgi:hypothetical protein